MPSCNKYILSNFGTNHHRHTRALLISEEFLKKFEHLVLKKEKRRKRERDVFTRPLRRLFIFLESSWTRLKREIRMLEERILNTGHEQPYPTLPS